MAHECEECGMMCYCDGEDTVLAQTDDCVHWGRHDSEGGSDDYDEYDEGE
jgi:hypothetical protein